jgi:hypothetical protein
MARKIAGKISFLILIIGLSLLTPAHAQVSEVGLAMPQEESLSDSAAAAIRANVSDERARLLVRLQANAPDQTPGAITTSGSELAGQMIANAMRRLIVVQPHDQPVLIAIAPQVDPDGTRQLVLLNLSAWISHGRQLGFNQTEAFAVLPDTEMRQPQGSRFQVDGVAYVGRVEGSSITFHRNP